MKMALVGDSTGRSASIATDPPDHVRDEHWEWIIRCGDDFPSCYPTRDRSDLADNEPWTSICCLLLTAQCHGQFAARRGRWKFLLASETGRFLGIWLMSNRLHFLEIGRMIVSWWWLWCCVAWLLVLFLGGWLLLFAAIVLLEKVNDESMNMNNEHEASPETI